MAADLAETMERGSDKESVPPPPREPGASESEDEECVQEEVHDVHEFDHGEKVAGEAGAGHSNSPLSFFSEECRRPVVDAVVAHIVHHRNALEVAYGRGVWCLRR